MSIKALVISSLLSFSPLNVEANQSIGEDRLCVSQTTQERVTGNQTLISGILSCRGIEPIAHFDSKTCTSRLLKPSEFMLEEMYTSCPFQNAILER